MFTNIDGQAPGTNTPIEKAPGACDSKRLTTDTNSEDYASHGPVNHAQGGNTVAHLTAAFALKGHIVIRGDRGDFSVTKYGMSRYCANQTELATFAKIVGAAQ